MKTSTYLQTEHDLGRMSGPFTHAETEHILRGPFYASPLIVAVQNQGPRLPPKRRVCCNLSKGDKTTNMGSVDSFINQEDFPTCFDLAFWVAQAVSVLFNLCSSVWISACQDAQVWISANSDACLGYCLFGCPSRISA